MQPHVWDAIGRDDRGWVLSVAHVVVVPVIAICSLPRLAPVEQAVGLRNDHDRIVRLAVDWLHDRYRARPDPDGLLPTEFTLRDLQLLLERCSADRWCRPCSVGAWSTVSSRPGD